VIKNSLDWNALETNLLRKTTGLKHEQQIRQMIGNIRSEVTELSKAEVLSRQGHKHRAVEVLSKVNNDIELVEEYLLVAALLG
jgi:hypothetical protein